jgi:hypothetical protein
LLAVVVPVMAEGGLVLFAVPVPSSSSGVPEAGTPVILKAMPAVVSEAWVKV